MEVDKKTWTLDKWKSHLENFPDFYENRHLITNLLQGWPAFKKYLFISERSFQKVPDTYLVN